MTRFFLAGTGMVRVRMHGDLGELVPVDARKGPLTAGHDVVDSLHLVLRRDPLVDRVHVLAVERVIRVIDTLAHHWVRLDFVDPCPLVPRCGKTLPDRLLSARVDLAVCEVPSLVFTLGGVRVPVRALAAVAHRALVVALSGLTTGQHATSDTDVVRGAVEEGLVASGHLTLSCTRQQLPGYNNCLS